MTEITQVLAVPVVGGYYCEDLAALQSQPVPVADRYTTQPVTPGFRQVREVAEAVSVGLVLDDGRVAWGDCVAVAYAGLAGRPPVFRARDGQAAIHQVVAPLLQGRQVDRFRPLAAEIDDLTVPVEVERPLQEGASLPEGTDPARRELLSAPVRFLRAVQGDKARPEATVWVVEERRLHPAVRYGVSQALLQAVAWVRGLSMAEVVADEWALSPPDRPIPIHAQSGGARYRNADKMIARRVASLPHALVDDIPEQLGDDGTKLTRYVRWLKERIGQLAGPDYRPAIHLDVHGALGQICANNLGRVLGELQALSDAAAPYRLRIECPVLLDSREAQIEALRTLRDYVRFRRLDVQLVADEWANTLEEIRAFVEAQAVDVIQIKMPDLGGVHNAVEAVLACQAGGVGTFLGGSCCETGLSARVSVHVALATRPDLIMAKPGMGVDAAVMLVQNEMARTLAAIRARTA